MYNFNLTLVLIALSDVLRDVMSDVPSFSVGRWGGEAFMILLPDSNLGEATAPAEAIRTTFAAVSYEAPDYQT